MLWQQLAGRKNLALQKLDSIHNLRHGNQRLRHLGIQDRRSRHEPVSEQAVNPEAVAVLSDILVAMILLGLGLTPP